MRTTMLDAIRNEAGSVMDLASGVVFQARELASQISQLHAALESMAGSQAAAPPSISSTATAEEFREFQATYFPFIRVLNQESPGDLPETQDGEQGKNGSGVVAPGEAAQRPGTAEQSDHVEPEQAVTEAALEERDEPRTDPEAAPDALVEISLKDRFLDLYAVDSRGPTALAEELGCIVSQATSWLYQARRNSDVRAAKGDVLRSEPAKEPESRARPKPYDPPIREEVYLREDDVPFTDPAPGQPLVEVDLTASTVTYRGQTIVVSKVERRLVARLNDQLPYDSEPLMQAASVMTGRSLEREIKNLNGRISAIDLEVHKDASALFTLRRKIAEF